MMKEINLGHLDLNLLVTFEVLMRVGNVTRAADELGRTQSAISHSLSRLRDQLGDPLLVKAGGKMSPTPFAIKLIENIRPILQSIQHVVSPPEPFCPSTSTRIFRLAFPDISPNFVTEILAAVQNEAPRVAVEWLKPTIDLIPLIAGGQIDIGELSGSGPLPEGAEVYNGPTYSWMTYMRKDHPAIKDWGLSAWQKWPHVQVFMGNSIASPVDGGLKADSDKRNVMAKIPSFSSLGRLLQRTDYLATFPPFVMVDAMLEHGLRALKPPVDIPPVSPRFFWSFRLTNDPGSRWFRNLVIKSFAEQQRKAKAELTALWLQDARGN